MHVARLLEKRISGLKGRDLLRILSGPGKNSQQLERIGSLKKGLLALQRNYLYNSHANNFRRLIMKAKTASPSKKKAGSGAKKKTLSASRKKPAAAAKKRPAAASKGKPVSLAKQKLELHKQIKAFVSSAFNGRRMAYFVSAAERKERAYIMCFAVEGEAGFYKADWGWHCSLAKAKAETALMNKKLGLNEEEVNRIIISTMGPVIRKKK
jgi:hypothetical protein